jgi:large subunit ribosomal protein L18
MNMARGPTYSLPFRRRREQKTDYESRRTLLVSGIPRLVIRITGKHTIAQLTESTPLGDKVLAHANSGELTSKYGWKGGSRDLPAAYLTGLLAGMRASSNSVNEAIVDAGLRRVTKGSRVFSALKGAADSGLKIPYREDILPDQRRVRGEHIANYAKALSSDPEQYKRRFSRYLASGLKPEDLPEHFEQVKKQMMESQRKEAQSA